MTSLMELDVHSNDITSLEPLIALIPRCPNIRYINVRVAGRGRGGWGPCFWVASVAVVGTVTGEVARG